jgi:hypothetical protein
VIAISEKGYAVSANTGMAYSAVISEDGSRIEKIA